MFKYKEWIKQHFEFKLKFQNCCLKALVYNQMPLIVIGFSEQIYWKNLSSKRIRFKATFFFGGHFQIVAHYVFYFGISQIF